MKELKAKDIEVLREKRIYTAYCGKKIDVTFTPYKAQVMYDELMIKQGEVMQAFRDLGTVVEEVKAGQNIEENEKKILGWKELKDAMVELNWNILDMVLKMNGNQYTLGETQEFLSREEMPFLIQFIMGLDDASKKNEPARVNN